ncbi:hypothetical protein PM082_003433 [Marasmius tenuissimus]|nr:hypothetical protein PM082_003433 [Marasmius tenuissimus]
MSTVEEMSFPDSASVRAMTSIVDLIRSSWNRAEMRWEAQTSEATIWRSGDVQVDKKRKLIAACRSIPSVKFEASRTIHKVDAAARVVVRDRLRAIVAPSSLPAACSPISNSYRPSAASDSCYRRRDDYSPEKQSVLQMESRES